MALSLGGPVLETLETGKLYFDKNLKLMIYFHAVPNAALIRSHIQSALKWNSLLICSARLEKSHKHFAAVGDVAGIYCLESKENWSKNDWATVSREAKARRGKSMKTCTRIGRVISTVSAVGKWTEGINPLSKIKASLITYYSLENNLVPTQTNSF